MPIYLEKKNERCSLSVAQLEDLMGFSYLSTLILSSSVSLPSLKKRCLHAKEKTLFSREEIWLGAFYEDKIASGYFFPYLYLKWLGPKLEYGLFSNRVIPPHTFIGEYSGLLRKRRFFQDRKNAYCFEYALGEKKENSYLIDARDQGNLSRFINHHETGNVTPHSLFSTGMAHIVFITNKKIEKDEELTYNYGEKYWEKREKPSLYYHSRRNAS